MKKLIIACVLGVLLGFALGRAVSRPDTGRIVQRNPRIGSSAFYMSANGTSGIRDPFVVEWDAPSRPNLLLDYVITFRGIDLPLLSCDRIDMGELGHVPVDWLDMEIWGDPFVAQQYRLHAPELHEVCRNAILATLPDPLFDATKSSLK